MKIVRLKLQNLASLAGEQEINFEADPLQHAGLIAITGATGAGKSTLLDAMCLALFNKIPRLKTHEGKLKDVSGQDVQIDSTLNILRRGTAHAYSELEFIAQNQKRYIARWELKRARGHAEGKLQAVQRALVCVTDGNMLTDKAKECDKQVLELIGLSFEQFTRAVLLAQSEVGAFLKAKDNERADLLEYLTNSNIFSLVGKAAFERTKMVRVQREKLNELIGHVELLSTEQMAQLEDQYKARQQQVQQLEQHRQILRNELQWHKSHDLLYTQIQAKQEFYQVQLDANQKLGEQRQRLQQLEQFASIRPILLQQKRCEQQLQNLEKQISQHQQLFQQVCEQYQAAQKSCQAARTAVENEKLRQNQLAPYLNQAKQFLDQRKLIESQYTQVRNKLKEKTAEQQQQLEQLQQAQQQYQQLENIQQQLQQQLAQSQQLCGFDSEPQASLQHLKAYIAQAQQASELYTQDQIVHLQIQQDSIEQQLHKLVQHAGDANQLEQKLRDLYQQREQQLERIYQFEQLQHQLERWQIHYIEHQSLDQNIHQLKSEIQELHNAMLEQQSAYEHDKKERELLQKQLQQQRLLFSENIEQLRAALQPDEPCMVCGSQQHPYREQQHLLEKSLLAIQEQQEKNYLQKEQEAQNQWLAARQQYLKQETVLSHLQQQQQYSLEQIQQLQQQLQHKYSFSGLELLWEQPPEQLLLKLGELQQVQLKVREQLDFNITETQKTQSQYNELVRQLEKLRAQCIRAQQLQQLATPILKKLPSSQHSDWHDNSLQEAQHIYQVFQNRLLQLEQLNTHKGSVEQLNLKLQPQQLQYQYLNTQIVQLEQELEQLKQQGLDNVTQVKELTLKVAGQTYEQAQHWLDDLTQQLSILEQSCLEKQQYFEGLQQNYQQQQSKISQFQATRQHVQQEYTNIYAQVQHWLNDHPDYSPELIEFLVLQDATEEQRIRQLIQANDRGLSEAKTALNTLQEQFEQHLATKPAHEFEQLQNLLENLEIQLEHTYQERDQLRTKLEIQQHNLHKQQQFQKQIVQVQQEEYRWSRISELIGSADGARFKKLAQEHHLDILVEYANQQLQPLAPRYQLQRIEDSLGLAIIDHHMNGEVRPVLSLSGGETFLVSLALALAIANMASGSMKIESLFIDEGFGTLDPASLHVVMDALDRLQGQGRKVTLISHVQEMHERIPIQIQVKAVGSGASRIQIVG